MNKSWTKEKLSNTPYCDISNKYKSIKPISRYIYSVQALKKTTMLEISQKKKTKR